MIAFIVLVTLFILTLLCISGQISFRGWSYETEAYWGVMCLVAFFFSLMFFTIHEPRVVKRLAQKVEIVKTTSAVMVEADGEVEVYYEAGSYNSITPDAHVVVQTSWNHFGMKRTNLIINGK